MLLSDGSKHPYKGVVDFVNREIDASTGAILIQASFPNTNLILKPGQYTRVKIKYKDEKGALLIPQRVVSELQGEYSVFIVNNVNKIESSKVVEFFGVKSHLSILPEDADIQAFKESLIIKNIPIVESKPIIVEEIKIQQTPQLHISNEDVELSIRCLGNKSKYWQLAIERGLVRK